MLFYCYFFGGREIWVWDLVLLFIGYMFLGNFFDFGKLYLINRIVFDIKGSVGNDVSVENDDGGGGEENRFKFLL